MVYTAVKIILMLFFGIVCLIIGNTIWYYSSKKLLDANRYNMDMFLLFNKFSVWLIEKGYWMIYSWMKPADNIKLDAILQLLERQDW